MSWKQWAYLEKVSSADFQAFLQNQVIAQFTTPAQRDTVWGTPPKGARCITLDTLTVWEYTGTQWARPWQTPWGQIGYQQIVASSAATTGAAVLSAAVTSPANRRLRVRVVGMLQMSVLNAVGRTQIQLDGVQQQWADVLGGIAGRPFNNPTEVRYSTVDAVAHTWSAYINLSVGTGTVLMFAAAGIPAFIAVDDIGPVAGTLPA